MRSAAHGLSIDAPSGWEVRISRRQGGGPVLHAATFPLQAGDGDFGAAATGRMRADDAFAALIEYPASRHIKPGSGLFKPRTWRPRLRVADFSPAQLQVTRPGHIGLQQFFTQAGRPFCLYAVVTPVRKRPERLVAELARVLGTLGFTP